MSIGTKIIEDLMRDVSVNSRKICEKCLAANANLRTTYSSDVQLLHNDFMNILHGKSSISTDLADALETVYPSVHTATEWKAF